MFNHATNCRSRTDQYFSCRSTGKGLKTAAERLSKTPAAVSLQIKRLEETLGIRVLERSNQGISLMSAGEILKDRGQQLMALNYELLGDLQEHDLSGQLNFGAPTDYAPTLLQTLLPIFQQELPRVSLSLFLEPSRSLRPKVSTGTLDMAIVAREPDSLEGEELWAEQIAWFGAKDYDATFNRIGVLNTNCVLRDRALEDLSANPTQFKQVLEAATVASLRDAVEARFCQALLPVSVVHDLEQSTQITCQSTSALTFALIAGPRFDPDSVVRIAKKFRRVLRTIPTRRDWSK